MPNKTKKSMHIDLIKMADSYKVSRLFLTAIELHIFEMLKHKELTAKDIAELAGTNNRATEILLNALTALDLLEKKSDKYANSPVVLEMLGRASTDFILASFRHQNNSWKQWSPLTQIVQTGESEKAPWCQAKSTDFALTMKAGAAQLAEKLDLMVDFSAIHHICDLGCGPGAITIELLQTHSHTTAVLIDLDETALKIAHQDAADKDLQDRVEIINQNILTEPLDGNFDLVILSLVLCLIHREEVILLLKKIKSIMRPGGTLIIGEILLDDSKTHPLSAAFFAVHMLVNGSEGNLFSLGEICQLLHDCGIRYECNFPGGLQHIIVGKNEPH